MWTLPRLSNISVALLCWLEQPTKLRDVSHNELYSFIIKGYGLSADRCPFRRRVGPRPLTSMCIPVRLVRKCCADVVILKVRVCAVSASVQFMACRAVTSFYFISASACPHKDRMFIRLFVHVRTFLSVYVRACVHWWACSLFSLTSVLRNL